MLPSYEKIIPNFQDGGREVPFCPNHCLYLNILKKNQVNRTMIRSHLADLRTEMQVVLFPAASTKCLYHNSDQF